MHPSVRSAVLLRISAVVVALIVVATTRQALAQDAADSAPPLPVSGRSMQTGSATVTQAGVPGLTTSVETLTSAMQAQGAVLGSTASTTAKPFSGKLTLREAVERGLDYNLSAAGMSQAVRQARSQQTIARSALLPNIVGFASDSEQRVNLASMGVQFDVPLPGFTVPEVAGPFNVVDLRARLSQSVVSLVALNNYRAARETARASEFAAEDSKDIVVLAIGGAYLQAVAAKAQVQAARTRIETVTAMSRFAAQQRTAGLATPVDANRADIQMLTEQQRLVSLQADFARRKIVLARMTGLAPTDQYDLADDVTFAPAQAMNVDEAVRQALDSRADVKTAEAQVRAAERALAAAQARRLPSLNVTADYGVNRGSPAASHNIYAVTATVRVPIWEGNRTAGEMEQAQAALAQRRAELEDQKAQVEGDVRKAWIDVGAAASQVQLAQENLRLSTVNRDLARQGFETGLENNIRVIQAQESVAAAELAYMNSVVSHNLAKLGLARALGRAAEALPQFLSLP